MRKLISRSLLVVCLAGISCQPFTTICDSADPGCSPPAILLYLLGCNLRLLGGAIQGCPGLDLNGTVSTFAGSGATGSVDGAAGSAQFNAPEGLSTDGVFLYVSDSANERIRRIALASGTVDTLAGDGGTGLLDGPGATAQFNGPKGLTTDGQFLYVVDQNNHRIRRIHLTTREVTTFAGTTGGFQDGPAATAQFSFPTGVTTDGFSLYVGDTGNNRVRRIDLGSGVVSTLSGDGTAAFLDGAAARFNGPRGVTTDGFSVFVVDQTNERIRQIVLSTGFVTTVAGSGSTGFQDGALLSAQFNGPFGIVTDGQALYVADRTNHRIRKIDPVSRQVSVIAGDGTGAFQNGTGSAARFHFPFGLTSDGVSLYVGDAVNERIRRIQ